jgi:uncharacterized OsmC-like protein
MTSKIKYTGNLRTEATHLKSGNSIITDAPTDNNGKGEAFSPTDLVATALGSCILTIMGIKAKDAEIDMDGAEVEITKVMASNPRRISKIIATIQMPQKDYSTRDKKILEKAAHHCPVFNSLSPDLEEEINLFW